MHCPHCSYPHTYVQDTRQARQGTMVRRKRTCRQCSKKFITIEHAQSNALVVMKRNGAREAFDTKKVENSIHIAFKKGSVNPNYIANLVSQVVQVIEKKYMDTIASSDIANVILKHLKRRDDAAYIRFVAFHKSFTSMKEFIMAYKRHGDDSDA